MAEQTTATPASAPDKQAVRQQLESTRAAYHELLNSLDDAAWKTKSANPAWSVGQLMWHLGRGVEFSVQAVGYCRKGKGPNPPAFLINPGNVLLTRLGSRGATPGSAARGYDRHHEALLACLDGIGDEEWTKGARIYGTDYTIASALQLPIEHFREHEADIKMGLGRP